MALSEGKSPSGLPFYSDTIGITCHVFLSFSALVGKRHIVTFLIFLGMANAYIMRTNMSVAIVAMVNHTANLDHTEEIKTVNECGETITNETAAAQRVSTRIRRSRCGLSFRELVKEKEWLKNISLVATERRWTIYMGQQEAELSVEFVFLGIRYHTDTVRYTRQALWRKILPRNRYADQFGLRLTGPRIRVLGIRVVGANPLHPRFRRGK